MAHEENIAALHHTLKVLNDGMYTLNGEKRALQLNREQMGHIQVYLPDEVRRIEQCKDFQHIHTVGGRTGVGCFNEDAFALAIKRCESFSCVSNEENKKPVLVLNLANPVHPGGGVRRGSRAQEEDLCRRSSLLLSLESEAAKRYYHYNRSLNTYMGSDAIMITPAVEVIKDQEVRLLDRSQIVSVMTCAAPMVTGGFEGMTDDEYREMLYHRITGMLKVAALLDYKYLVLGAFGCGAFGNDAKVVSDVFYRAMKDFDYDGMHLEDFFSRIDFAVRSRSSNQYNFREFSRNFDDFYRKEKQERAEAVLKGLKEKEVDLDRIQGCLYGGAVGDALGYPIEFWDEKQIFSTYGPGGLTRYQYDQRTGKALISDDTQMTLFTANGVLSGDTRIKLRGIGASPSLYVAYAYQDWLLTQRSTMEEVNRYERYTAEGGYSWLLDIPELYSRRAPGNTCLTALKNGVPEDRNYIDHPANNSKGCGGIMRVSPLALFFRSLGVDDYRYLDEEGAQIAAITHGHSLGYMPAAVLTHILVHVLATRGTVPLKRIILEARDAVKELFASDPHINELCNLIDLAVKLAERGQDDLTNIHLLGEGWVAEETLAIAIYCSLKYQNDFSSGVIAAANHQGDSDSTGAVTGNILGAWLGYSQIEDKWKHNLELSDVILEMAEDLCHGCPIEADVDYQDPAWETKYVYMHRYQKEQELVFFWKSTEKNGEFSNWYPSTFVVDDFQYLHAEQFIMAKKAKLFHDAVHYTQILRATDPRECRELGRRVTPFDPSKWDNVKYDIALEGVREKFRQNPNLLQKLLDTGSARLAESSPCDTVWGIGLTAEEAAHTEMHLWPGRNLLGKILMEVRDSLA